VPLKVEKPKPQKEFGDSVGAHLRRRRRALGIGQREVANILVISESTLLNWENGKAAPADAAYPAVIQFLGYEPWDLPSSLREALRAERRRRGISVKEAAKLLPVDEGSWSRWERGEWKPTARTLPKIDKFLGLSCATHYPADIRVQVSNL
jgi:transcriptional regulator with XRE-family HTH domain